MRMDKYCACTLAERVDITDDLAVFHFQLEEPLTFTPGQYATLALPVEGSDRPVQRPYSVASSPHEELLELFVERVAGGALTPLLWDAPLGTRCFVRRRVVGLFVLDRDAGRTQHAMISTVTGIAPYVSIIRAQQHALAEGTCETPHRILVLHGASFADELSPYREELEAAAQAHDWLDYVPTVSRPWDDPGWTGERGRVGDVLRKHLDAHGFVAGETIAYACGNPLMIENVKTLLRRAGFADEHVREEKYFRA